jgi:hypothetical protein
MDTKGLERLVISDFDVFGAPVAPIVTGVGKPTL